MTKLTQVAKEKIWGNTSEVAAHPGFQVHFLRINAGTYCSRHCHEHKWNIFYVTRGVVSVRTYPGPKGPEDSTKIDVITEVDLHPGESLIVPPGVWHRFVAYVDSEMIEVYSTPAVREDDIERFDVGGVIPQGGLAP